MKNQNTINIARDNSFSFHPLHDIENLGHFALHAGNYNIADQNYIENLRNTIISATNFAEKYYNEYDLSNLPDLEALGDKLGLFAVKLPVYGYIHSGIALSLSNEGQFSCPFDSGKAGFIYVTKKDIRKNFGIKKVTQKYIELSRKILISEFNVLSDFLDGHSYGFEIVDENEEVIDSCGGFIGSDIHKNGILDYIPEELHDDAISSFNNI